MPSRHLHLASNPSDDVADAFAALRAEVGLPAMFPSAVRAEADDVAADEEQSGGGHQDRRDLDLVTIDPPGAMDLDQAVHVASSGRGYIVRYAVADVAAFVRPGGALDAEAHRRGTTVYGPDSRTPLHPPVLSEGAASLLPDEDRPAVLWTIGVDAAGEVTSTSVARALVRSRARLTYGEAQSSLDAGTAPESLTLLADVGRLRHERERDRGGVSLDVPEQEIVSRPGGGYGLELRRTLPVEGWNAQISQLTGMAAAAMMKDAGVGLLRTLPPAGERDVARLRRTAAALGIDWSDEEPYAALLARLESRRPTHAAFLHEATSLFRGAGYLALGDDAGTSHTDAGATGTGVPPVGTRHAAIAAEYAHVTAPLRRLADRYAAEVCVALAAGREVPAWVTAALPALPATMATAGSRAATFERGCLDIVTAALLSGREGEAFDGVVVDVRDGAHDGAPVRGEVMLRDPAVTARLDGVGLELGARVRVTLTEASVKERRVRFTLA